LLLLLVVVVLDIEGQSQKYDGIKT
jgi:hypothetical protein